ncbi:hypothetical protein AO242_27770 [Pseudomonas sp. ICMP 561]|nr:hypothetical protein AO242_27770 [Pseudomonas sp. ICMP 561]
MAEKKWGGEMVVYENLDILISEFKSLDKFGTLFVNRVQWARYPADAQIFLLVGDDELEDLNDQGCPVLAAENDAEYLLDVELFQSVVELQIEKMPDSAVSDFIFSINYYLENDDFYAPH